MNKDTTLGFILIAVILIGYSIWMTPSKEEVAERQRKADSITQIRQQARIIDSIRMAVETEREALRIATADTFSKPVADQTINKDVYGAFAISSVGEQREVVLENDVYKITLSTKGGHIKKVELKNFTTWDSLPLVIFEPSTAHFDISFFSRNRTINSSQLYFQPYFKGKAFEEQQLATSGEEIVFGMRALAETTEGDESYIEFEYQLKPDEYMLGFNINFVGLESIISANTTFANLEWNVDLLQQERAVDRFNGSTIYFKHFQDDVDYLSETKNDEKSVKTRVKWISFKQRFFSSSIIASESFDNASLRTYDKDRAPNPRYLKSMEALLDIPLSGNTDQSFAMSLYFGPNSFTEMRAYDLDLERQIPLGWGFFLLAWINIYLVIPIFNFLGSYGWNYGIVILVLTFILKLFLFPIAYKTYLSSAKMRVLKPEIDEISAKFPKQEDAMKKQQAVMGLYKKAGVNPMAGCVPMLLQMPILIAMFRFFPSSIELRQKAFLWATDLSSYDSVLDLPFEIPFYGAHVSLFTLLMTVSTIIYTYLNNEMMGQQSTQLPGMKTMMYMMPIMFLGLFNNYASGLSYYYLLANLITFAQMYIFRLSINEDKLRAKIEENKKKPVKKSAFQKRLEDAAKQRGMKV
jgi:YidC/Oxa1 family membrane protein insertase